MYTIYKFSAPYKGYQTGDDIIVGGAPFLDGGGNMIVQGEIYGSGYLGQIDAVPMSVLAVDAQNIDAAHLEDYINYNHLPTPQSNPNSGNIPTYAPMPASMGGTSGNSNKMRTVIIAAIVGVVAYFGYKHFTSAEA